MDTQETAELLRKKGVALLDKPHSKSPGHNGLLIALRSQPARDRFDPVALRLRLKEAETGLCQPYTLRHSNSCRSSRHVCPGQVTLIDVNDSGRDFFTFGGELVCTIQNADFIHRLNSSAPILDLRGSVTSIPDQLAAETDALLAEVEAKWKGDEEEFSLRLAAVDPFRLYVCAIESIMQHYHRAKSLMDTFRDFSDALHWEKGWLEQNKLWPKDVTTIEELIGTP